TCWVKLEEDAPVLCALFEVRESTEYIEPGFYACLGQLAFFADSLPDLAKSAVRFSVTPVPKEWLDACDAVLPLLGSFGLNGRFKGRTLEIESGKTCDQPIKAAGLSFLALDSFTRAMVHPAALADAQREAVRLFRENADDLLELLDGGAGEG